MIEDWRENIVAADDSTELFPVFIKPEQLNLLIIGGGKIALENLHTILDHFPETKITLIGKKISTDIKNLSADFPNFLLCERAYNKKDFDHANLIIAAVGDAKTTQQIKNDAQQKDKLVHIANQPEHSDFFLGTVVKKEHLQIAIAANGKSHDVIKKIHEIFRISIPSEVDEILNDIHILQERLAEAVHHQIKISREAEQNLEDADERLAEFAEETPEAAEIVETSEVFSKAAKYSHWYLIGLAPVLLIGLSVFALYEFGVMEDVFQFLAKDHHIFYWMLLAGFIAEIVAGSMGMGYGVMCTTTLLILNIPPPIVSASIHSAESFTSAAGSISHWKLGNVNKKLTWALAVPAILGAILGALALTYFGERYARFTKPFIAAYTLYLGITILRNAFKKREIRVIKKKTNITTLGLIGGFIDSFGGGGWGPLVTGTFIKNGRTPRYVVGSSTVAKFILTITSAITFIFTIGIHHWNIVAGLLIGGIVTAPFSAMLTSKLPVKKMFVVVGIIVIIMSLITIYRAIFL